MLKAQIHGKLASEIWQTNEDLLTSAVLGTIANLPDEVTSRVLATVTMLDGGEPPIAEAPLTWEFWPWWDEPGSDGDGCEPDAVLYSGQSMVLVEAKLWSAFGTEVGKRDQLDREWRHGTRRARETDRRFWLVTVTSHIAMPADEIRQQLRLVDDCDFTRVGWTNWTRIGRALRDLKTDERHRDIYKWLEDVDKVLEITGQAPFDGYAAIAAEAATIVDALRHDPLFWRPTHALGLGFGDVVTKTARLDLTQLAWLKERLA